MRFPMSKHCNHLNRTLIVLMLWLVGFSHAWASVPAGYSEYFIPVDEDNEFTILNALGGITAGESMHSIISVTPWADNTVIYYDHWEDGYDYDSNNPTTADETCTANVGQIKNFESVVPRPRTAANVCTGQASPASCTVGAGGNTDYCYDGRDRIIVVGGGSTVVRGGWPQTTGVVTGLAEEVYPVTPQLTTYILPFGEDIYTANTARTDYRRVFVTVQATENTTFQIDFDPVNGNGYDAIDCDHDGTTDGTQCTLNIGEIYRLDQTSDGTGGPFATLNSGTVIQGSATLQVQYLNGDSNATYNSRATSAFPRGFWDDEYYAPVGSGTTAGNDTDILLHNPNGTAITIDWETRTGSGSFTLNAYESNFFQAKTGSYVPNTSGVYLKGSDVFWGVSDVDTNSSTRDWAYSLVPAYLLDDEQFLSWSPGCYSTTTGTGCMTTAGNRDDGGVFITPSQDNTTVFVDTDNNGTIDYQYLLNRLQIQFVYDTVDGDLTGAHIWATAPYVLSYGENLETSPTASPGLDAGYTTLPNPGNWMDLALTVEKSTNPALLSTLANPATTSYTLTVSSHEFNIDGVSVTDSMAADWDYVVGTDTATITLPDGSTVTADPAKTGASCGTDGGSCVLTWTGLGNMAPNQTLTIIFTARTVGTPSYASGALSQNKVDATGTRTVGGVTQTFKASDFAYNTYLDGSVDMLVTKSSSVAETTPVSPGDTLTYTINVANPASSTVDLTGVALYDALPTGISYVAGSGSVSCERAANVRDEFASAAYTNNGPNNTANWSGNWTETDNYGNGATGATGGLVWITGGQLQFRYLAGTLLDQFGTAAYNNSNGTNTWSTSWTEGSGLDGSASTASNQEIYITGGRLRFDRSTGGTNFSVRRTASIPTGSGITITFTPTDQGFGSGEAVVAEYSIDGGTYSTLGTFDGGTGGWSGNLQTYTLNNFSGSSITLQFRATSAWNNNNDHMEIDNVQIAFNDSVETKIVRTADLTGASNPALNFTHTSANLEASDILVVEASNSASGPFTTLATITGGSASAAPPYDLTPYISANTTVRFRVTGGYNATNESTSFDNVDISYTTSGTFASANPPNFLASATGCRIPPNQSLTLTFNATVDNPFPTGLDEILNSASATASEIPIPIGDNARNIVVVPAQSGATVGDRVWLDSNGDGVLDVGESGLANVQVVLKDQFGTPLQTAVTDSQGFYQFTGVAPGSGYYVEATSGVPAGLTQSNGTLNRSSSFTLTAGQNYDGADIGYETAAGTALIGDRVWSDADGDGLQDAGEPGLAGIVVQLYTDSNGNGLIDDTETFVETTTGANGSYSFSVTATGTEDYITYISTTQTALSGYTLTTVDGFAFANVGSGSSHIDSDFGAQQTAVGTTFSIADRLWLDDGAGGGSAGDGVLNGGEAGIAVAGITVDLLDASGSVIATTATASDGSFAFTGVPGGVRYSWRVTDTGASLAGYYGTTSYAQSGTYQMSGTLTANVDYTLTPHFGYNLARSVGDTVFNDSGAGGGTSGNGVQDGGETGISGTAVKLYNDGDGDGVIDAGVDLLQATLVTDANGKYLFSGLANGNYIVSIESPPAGYIYTSAPDSDPGTTGQQRAAAISAGGNSLDNDFGYRADTPRTLSGTIWSDTDNNGANDAEPGIGNVTLELYSDTNGDGIIDSGDALIATAATASDGSYSFAGIQGGGTEDYVVRITDTGGALGGYSATFEKTETTTAPFNNLESIINLNSDVSDLNFGFYNAPPTYALISDVRAYISNGQAWIEWSTLQEHGTVGFFVERQDPASGAWLRLNDGKMLRGLIVSAQGGDYRIADPDVAAGETRSYRIVEREIWGTERTYGPWPLTVADQDAAAATQPPGTADSASSAADEWQSLGYNYTARAHRIVKKLVRSGQSVKALTLPASGSFEGQRDRLRTGEAGLYRLDSKNLADIAAMWLWNADDFYQALEQGQVLLGNADEITPYYYDSGDNSLYFVGNAHQTLETHDNVYRLKPRPGSKMPVVEGALPQAAVPGVFRDTQNFEDNSPGLLLPWLHGEEDADYWYWDYAYPPYVPSVTLTLQLPEPSDNGRGVLKIYLRGGSDEAAGDDRQVTAKLNGVPLSGSISWNGNGASVLQTEFDQAALGAAVNGLSEVKLQIDGIALNGADYDFFLIDRVDVEYDRKMRAYRGGVWMRGIAPGVAGVGGFGSDKITVIENPGTGNAKWRKDIAVTADPSGGYQTSFNVAATADYLLAETPKTVQVEADAPSDLKAKDTASDYLIIAPRELGQGATALSDYRKHGFSTEIVWLDDIYDEFSAGRTDSAAIEAFLDYAYQNRSHPPRYVVLLGRGTFDHRDLLGYRESLLPLRLAGTPWGLAGSDVRYADVDGDKLPDYLLGRIVVSSDADALAYVDKLIAYEASVPAAWSSHTALVADNADDGGNFPANSDQIAQLLQTYPYGYTVDKLYSPTVDVRKGLLDGWAGGYGYVNYMGHGGATQLGTENFLTTGDVAGLANGDKLPVFAALSCSVGDSTYPGILSLADALVAHPGGGAVAAFSPTGLSYDDQAVPLNKYFVETLLGNREDIGNAALFAHQNSATIDGIDGFMHEIYQISGDPAVRLRQ
jgi:uncharacterized repeat protein (TIGR01451 family)